MKAEQLEKIKFEQGYIHVKKGDKDYEVVKALYSAQHPANNKKNMKAEPLDDRVLIIPDPPEQVTPGGIIIPDSAKQYDQKKKGTVIACGTGHVAENTGVFTPIAVKVGDKVVFPAFGGQEIKGSDIGMEGDYLLLREMDIDFIIAEGAFDLISFYEKQIANLHDKILNNPFHKDIENKNFQQPFENFAMLIPTDIERHPNGTPIMYVSQEDKIPFIKWCEENNYTDENTTWEQRDELFLKWKEITYAIIK